MKLKTLVGSLVVAGVMVPGMAQATNGMNLEGYGPIATAMGGASMAYDNGLAAVMNNPATLGLAPQGDRLDVAVGGLHPDIVTKMNGMPLPNANSGGDAYYMPAGGWARKKGNLAYGFAVMAQGGMGTEYGSSSFMSMGDAGPTGKAVRSEVGVGRAIVPLAIDVNPQLTIAGSVELVWAGMDLQMLLPGSKMAPMMMPGGTSAGTVSGSMVSDRFFPAMGSGQMTGFNWGYFDFSNDNDFSGKAHSTGWAGTLGATYKISPQLTIGGSYHGKTALGDMEGSANVSFGAVLGPAMGPMSGAVVPVSVSGKISVRDFQWPETYGFGLAYQANDKLMIAADYKRIGWAKVMKDMKMSFSAEAGQADPMAQAFMLGGTQMDVTFNQNWKDQDVFQIGLSYKATDALTLRAGMNLANNPVPDSDMNALFPATIKDHYTLGAGYAFNKISDVNFSYSYAPNVTSTNSSMGYTVEHSQPHNWQMMYSHRF